jgi:hypothetical protein
VDAAASKYVFLKSWVLYTFILLSGCEVKTGNRESDDISAFQAIVDVNLPLRVVRWEIFGNPEDRGGVPGPTDFVTLIAEIEPGQSISPEESRTGKIWIAPEAGRPWLRPKIRDIFVKYSNGYVDISAITSCKPLQAHLRKTGKLVPGFICSDAERSTVYLTIFASTS